MADVDSGGGGGGGKGRKGGGPKTKKKSTRIDMTAMVDVAFLLLTFFVLTATMTNSHVMQLNMPPKIEDPELLKEKYKDVDEEKVVTIVLEADDKITYYQGITDPEIQYTDFSKNGIRKAVLQHLRRKPALCKEVNNAQGCWDPMFVIKPRPKSRYKNLVDLLDEMAITGAPKYAIDKFTEIDSLLLIGELKPE